MSATSNSRAAATGTPGAADRASVPSLRLRERTVALARAARPELLALVALAAVLNLWSLSRNGWANEYYAAAVRSMSTSWHNFLFASLDRAGVMTVDKPPLALWVQALSVRLFGYHSLSLLVPQALMGVASVALLYDLVRRVFGRAGGFVAGLTLALTPITVAISRHNNPDALLVLCSVAALWCTVRALQAGPAGRSTRWLVSAGVCVGLGFETKMGVALAVVPGIAAAWLWVAPAARGRLHALRQLLIGGAAMTLVAGAWPALVELTPAADRPWISGTSNNTVFSLIFEYNGLGRVGGQSGGPGGIGGGTMFGGTPGPLRLLNDALGGQAGWLLGFGLVGGLAILIASRLRRDDARSGWLIAVGGAFLVTAVLFSFAGGIFHPYYVSLLAPFLAALVGAGAAQLLAGGLQARVLAPIAVLLGVATELVIRGQYPGQLAWLGAVLIPLGALAALALSIAGSRRIRSVALAVALGALMLAPASWALDTLGHATSGTFPTGGPASLANGGPGGFGGGRGGPAGRGGFGAGATGGRPGPPGSGGASAGGPPSAAGSGSAPGLFGPAASGAPGSSVNQGAAGAPAGVARGGFAAGGFGAAGGAFGVGAGALSSDLAYIRAHGGGTLGVASQSSAASAIIEDDADVAGLGGFSGRESDVSVSWLAQEVRDGKISWVLDDEQSGASSGGFGGLPGDSRTGSRTAMAAVAKACTSVTVSSGSSASAGTLYDCSGRAAALQALATSRSKG